jgi:hypothetical protein
MHLHEQPLLLLLLQLQLQLHAATDVACHAQLFNNPRIG